MIFGILMGGFVILLLIDVPIALALLGGSMIAMFVSAKTVMPAAQSMISTVDSFALLAIPLFIAAGDLMNRGGIKTRVVDLSHAPGGDLRGSLAKTGGGAARLRQRRFRSSDCHLGDAWHAYANQHHTHHLCFNG